MIGKADLSRAAVLSDGELQHIAERGAALGRVLVDDEVVVGFPPRARGDPLRDQRICPPVARELVVRRIGVNIEISAHDVRHLGHPQLFGRLRVKRRVRPQARDQRVAVQQLSELRVAVSGAVLGRQVDVREHKRLAQLKPRIFDNQLERSVVHAEALHGSERLRLEHLQRRSHERNMHLWVARSRRLGHLESPRSRGSVLLGSKARLDQLKQHLGALARLLGRDLAHHHDVKLAHHGRKRDPLLLEPLPLRAQLERVERHDLELVPRHKEPAVLFPDPCLQKQRRLVTKGEQK